MQALDDNKPSTTVKLSAEAEAFCREKLEALMESCHGVYGVLISTLDGHEVYKLFKREMPSSKLAAMTSSFMALGETIAREADQKLCRFVIVENSDGFVLTLKIGDRFALTTIAGKDTNLGMLHSFSKSSAEEIGRRIKI